MDETNIDSVWDGLVHPKRLQDVCLEFLASLTLEAIEFVTTSREQGFLQQQQQQEHELQKKGRAWDQASGGGGGEIDRALRHIKAYIGVEHLLGLEGKLPAHFCDQMLSHIASRKKLTDTVLRYISHRSMGSITKVHITSVLTPDTCLLYTSPSPRDATLSRMPSSA